jgi:hypothetical protein
MAEISSSPWPSRIARRYSSFAAFVNGIATPLSKLFRFHDQITCVKGLVIDEVQQTFHHGASTSAATSMEPAAAVKASPAEAVGCAGSEVATVASGKMLVESSLGHGK